MLGKFVDRILHEDEEEHKPQKPHPKKRVEEKIFNRKNLLLAIAVFVFAVVPRLLVLFLYKDTQFPGWYDDTFHHWQIGYLTKTVGLGQGFLRLWDFKGMEYFWGLLHPMVLVILFAVTGSVDILILRLLSVVGGSIVIVFVFFLVRRHFNTVSALAVVIFATFFPITLYSDTVGMQEPLGLVFLFGAFLLLPKRPLLSGFFISLAGMVRAEYWLFGAGLFVATIINRKIKHRSLFAVGWLVPTLLYMKYLLDHTGNAIYPVYWNFLASVRGDWFADVPLPPGAFEAQWVARGIFVFGVLGAFWTLIKKPRYYYLFLLGFGNILFLGFMIGFSAYIRGYVPRFWIDRLFAWPYVFLGILLSVVFLYWIPSKFKHKLPLIIAGYIIITATLLISQFSWITINKWADIGENRYRGEIELAGEVADEYKGGTILVPDDRPPFVYYLVRDHGLTGNTLLGQMFDPFYYYEGDPFNKWSNSEIRDEVLKWLDEFDVRLMVVYKDTKRYQNLIEAEPDKFKLIKRTRIGVEVYEVQPS